MPSKFETDLLQDLKAPGTYGRPLVGWRGQMQIYRDPAAPATAGPLEPKLTATFVEQVYFLLSIQRPVLVYRGYETAGLEAPFGKDHQSFVMGLVAARKPGTPDGRWWTPLRPRSIGNLGLSAIHRAEDRVFSAVKTEWNRIDYWIEAELRGGTRVYVGRAAPQQESDIYGRERYAGGAMQFRLTDEPARVFAWMRRYAAR